MNSATPTISRVKGFCPIPQQLRIDANRLYEDNTLYVRNILEGNASIDVRQKPLVRRQQGAAGGCFG
jgi:hypothetical protein